MKLKIRTVTKSFFGIFILYLIFEIYLDLYYFSISDQIFKMIKNQKMKQNVLKE
jgi:hypothetical protein